MLNKFALCRQNRSIVWNKIKQAQIENKSSQANEMSNWIKQYFINSEVECSVDILNDETIEITLSNYYDFDPIWGFEPGIRKQGWYATTDPFETGEDPASLWIHKTLTSEVKIPQFIYHLTNVANLDKIKQSGLLMSRGGKRHGFKYPARIYFTSEQPTNRNMDLGYSPQTKLVTLKIDTSKVSDLKLFIDPQFPDTQENGNWASAFAAQPIPIDAISIEQEL